MKTFIILFACISATFAANATFQQNFQNCVTTTNTETKSLLEQLFKKCVNTTDPDLASRTNKCKIEAVGLINDHIIKADLCINNISGIHFTQNFFANINSSFSTRIQNEIRQVVTQCMKKSGNDATECFKAATARDLQGVQDLVYITEKIYIQQFVQEITNCVKKQEYNATITLNSMIPKCAQIGKEGCKNSTQALVNALIIEGGECIKRIKNPAKIDPALVNSINSQMQQPMAVYVNSAIDECFAKKVQSEINICLTININRGIAEADKAVTDFENTFIGTSTYI